MHKEIEKEFLQLLYQSKDEMREIVHKCYDIRYLTELFEVAQRHKLSPNIFEILMSNGCENLYLLDMYKKYKEKNDKQVDLQIQIVNSINDNLQEEYAWIKGIPLSVILYNDPYFRQAGDIDLLVKPENQRKFVCFLENLGFRKLGIINEELGLRYSTHYHEIQLLSPQNVMVEVKKISGEMRIFENENMVMDFFAHIEECIVCDCKYATLNLDYTLIHLFLSALSNSTSLHDVYDNSLRELYEIVLLVQKYKIDYQVISQIAKIYGISFVIQEIMKKINTVFGLIFSKEVLSVFENDDEKTHMMSKLYKMFRKHYDIEYMDELFDVRKKMEAYFSALSRAYYQENIFFNENSLNMELLEYKIGYHNEKLRLELYLNSKLNYLKGDKLITGRFLLNDKNICDKYGYVFVFLLPLKEGKVIATLKNETEFVKENVEDFREVIVPKIYEKVNDKIHIIYEFVAPFLMRQNRVCYNLQLDIFNENDKPNWFNITILYPQTGTLPSYHVDYIESISD